jgi:hypothetical protein
MKQFLSKLSISLLGSVLLFSNAAFGAGETFSLSLAPGDGVVGSYFYFEALPGDEVGGAINAENTGEGDITLDVDYDPVDQANPFQADAMPADWFDSAFNQFDVDEGDSEDVEFTITPSDDAEAGVYKMRASFQLYDADSGAAMGASVAKSIFVEVLEGEDEEEEEPIEEEDEDEEPVEEEPVEEEPVEEEPIDGEEVDDDDEGDFEVVVVVEDDGEDDDAPADEDGEEVDDDEGDFEVVVVVEDDGEDDEDEEDGEDEADDEDQEEEDGIQLIDFTNVKLVKYDKFTPIDLKKSLNKNLLYTGNLWIPPAEDDDEEEEEAADEKGDSDSSDKKKKSNSRFLPFKR